MNRTDRFDLARIPRRRTSGAGCAIAAVMLLVAASCSDSSAPASSADIATPPTGVEALAVPNLAVDQELIDAAWANDVARARELIDRGGDVNDKDSTQQSAYLIATSEGYLDLLELTFEHGADVASLDSFNGTGLIRAAERGHADVVGRLLQTGIDVNHINNLGWTALHESIILGTGDEEYADTVRLLVAGGADVTLTPRDGTPPVQLARDRGQVDVAATLQAALDAPPTTTTAAADVALLTAAAAGDADGAAIALAAGATIETRDDRGRTALMLATSTTNAAVARLLVALGADEDAPGG